MFSSPQVFLSYPQQELPTEHSTHVNPDLPSSFHDFSIEEDKQIKAILETQNPEHLPSELLKNAFSKPHPWAWALPQYGVFTLLPISQSFLCSSLPDFPDQINTPDNEPSASEQEQIHSNLNTENSTPAFDTASSNFDFKARSPSPSISSEQPEIKPLKQNSIIEVRSSSPSKRVKLTTKSSEQSITDSTSSTVKSTQRNRHFQHIVFSKQQEGIFWPPNLKLKEVPVPCGSNTPWTNELDRQLAIAVQRCNKKNWKKIASFVKGKSAAQCSQRWQKVIDPSIKKGQWTAEEDEILLAYVRTHGKPSNWAKVCVDGRTAKQCRERFLSHLDPSLNKDKFSDKEDEIILCGKREGKSWAQILLELPGRTSNLVKSRYKTLTRSNIQ